MTGGERMAADIGRRARWCLRWRRERRPCGARSPGGLVFALASGTAAAWRSVAGRAGVCARVGNGGDEGGVSGAAAVFPGDWSFVPPLGGPMFHSLG